MTRKGLIDKDKYIGKYIDKYLDTEYLFDVYGDGGAYNDS